MPQTLDRLRFFSDVPTFEGFQWPEMPPEVGDPDAPKAPTSRVQVAKTGTFKHPRYGKFTVNRATFDSMVRNFDAGIPTDQLPADFDHEPDYGGSSEACGWVTKLEADGNALYASVEWRWNGAYAIRDKAYRYVSPTWSLAYTDESGEKHGPTLLAFGLTNRPYFTMPAVSLSASFSREEFSVCEEVENDPARPSDSRPPMELATFAQALGLPEDATEEQVLTATREAKEQADQEPETMTADQAKGVAEQHGFTVLPKDEATELQANATAGAAAAEELRVARFTKAFDAALNDTKGARVTPAQKDTLRELYDAAPEQALKLIEDSQPIVNARPAGSGGGNAETTEAPAGTDEHGFELDRKVKAYMAEHQGTGYIQAYRAVTAEAQAV